MEIAGETVNRINAIRIEGTQRSREFLSGTVILDVADVARFRNCLQSVLVPEGQKQLASGFNPRFPRPTNTMRPGATPAMQAGMGWVCA